MPLSLDSSVAGLLMPLLLQVECCKLLAMPLSLGSSVAEQALNLADGDASVNRQQCYWLANATLLTAECCKLQY